MKKIVYLSLLYTLSAFPMMVPTKANSNGALCKVIPTKGSSDRLTLLFGAIKENQTYKVQNLLRYSLDINGVNADGLTPLFFAVSEWIEYALEEKLPGGLGQNNVTVNKKNRNIIIASLVKNKANVNQQCTEITPLFYAITKSGARSFPALIKTLLENKADPNLLNKDKDNVHSSVNFHTPLTAALAGHEHLGVVKALLNGKADPNTANQQNILPFDYAQQRVDKVAVEALLKKAGAVPIYDRLLLQAIQAANILRVEYLIEVKKTNVNAKTYCQIVGSVTPLLMALYELYYEKFFGDNNIQRQKKLIAIADYLLEKKANPTISIVPPLAPYFTFNALDYFNWFGPIKNDDWFGSLENDELALGKKLYSSFIVHSFNK